MYLKEDRKVIIENDSHYKFGRALVSGQLILKHKLYKLTLDQIMSNGLARVDKEVFLFIFLNLMYTSWGSLSVIISNVKRISDNTMYCDRKTY